MKHPLSFLLVLLYLTACTKTAVSSNESEAAAGITGKWNLVTDSTFLGVGSSNHPVDYTGQAGDYFDFDANGYVYTREDTALDTLTYRLISDNAMVISDFGIILNGVDDPSTITGLSGVDLSGQTIIIESPRFLTPGGEFWRKVTLTR